MINNKIRNYLRKDNNLSYDDDDYITFDWVKSELKFYNYCCSYCDKELLLSNWVSGSLDQFTVHQLDNSVAHIKSNCVISCWGCSKNKSKKILEKRKPIIDI